MKILRLIIFAITISLNSFAVDYSVKGDGSADFTTINQVNAYAFAPGDRILFNRGETFYGSLTIGQSGITFGAYGTGANPIITGFTTVTSWIYLGSNIWESVNAVSTLSTCNMVVINGVNTPMGRIPNTGFYTYQAHNANLSITSTNLTGTPNWTGAEAVIKKEAWLLHRATITSQSGSTISYTDKESDNWVPRSGWGFFIQNDIRTLDTQNEWYYNPSTKKISVYSIIQPTDVKITTLDKLVNNTRGYITLDNLQFIGANTHGIYSVASHFTVTNCNISFIGLEGISTNWSSYLNFENNTLTNIGDIGINTMSHCDYETIKNNVIDYTSMIDGSGQGNAPGAIYSGSPNSLIQYNKIDHSGYDGILTFSTSGEIRNNYINNSCLNRDDGGGIYTGGNHTAMIIDGNIVLNSYGNIQGTTNTVSSAVGIYLDEGSNHVMVSNNLAANNGAGIFLHRGHDNSVLNNTTYNNLSGIHFANWTSSTTIVNNTINNNIFVAKSLTQLAAEFRSQINDIPSFGTASGNYYCRPIDDNKSIRAGQPDQYSGGNEYKTLAQWQTFSGQDANSKKSPQTITSESDLQFEYNGTLTAKEVILTNRMIDVKGNKYNGKITLQPFTSVVLIKDLSAPKFLNFGGKTYKF